MGEGEKVKEWGWRAEELKVGGTEVKNREEKRMGESQGKRWSEGQGEKKGRIRRER